MFSALHPGFTAHVYGCRPEMCSADNTVSAKLMLTGVKLPAKDKDELLLKGEDAPGWIKPIKGSSIKQVSRTRNGRGFYWYGPFDFTSFSDVRRPITDTFY